MFPVRSSAISLRASTSRTGALTDGGRAGRAVTDGGRSTRKLRLGDFAGGDPTRLDDFGDDGDGGEESEGEDKGDGDQ